MCDPNSRATIHELQSAFYLANEENRQANKYNRQLEQGYQANMVQLQEQRSQMGDQHGQEQSEIARQIAAERARLANLTNDAGVSGNTADRLQVEAAGAGDQAMATSARNYNQQIEQSQREAEAMRRQTRAQSRTGNTWTGLSLQLRGIQLAGEAANAQRIMANDLQRTNTNLSSSRPKFGDENWTAWSR